MRNDENQIGRLNYSINIFSYARIHIPIISSVSEHQPTMWTSFITDLHFLPAVAPAGLWYTIRNYDSDKIFLVNFDNPLEYKLVVTPCDGVTKKFYDRHFLLKCNK